MPSPGESDSKSFFRSEVGGGLTGGRRPRFVERIASGRKHITRILSAGAWICAEESAIRLAYFRSEIGWFDEKNWDPDGLGDCFRDENDTKHLTRVDRHPGKLIFVLKRLLLHLDGGEILLGSGIPFSYRKLNPDSEFHHDDQ